MKYWVVNENDWEWIGFKTMKEAKQFIKDLKAFNEEMGNPFEESYIIVKE